jgi:thiol-disulfide isomerase/thioredoxin
MNVRRAIRWSLVPLAIFTILLMADRLTQADDKPSDGKPSDTVALEGRPAPEFALQTVDGNPVKLSKLKGSVVLLDFWATWCAPCKVELPHTQQFSSDQDLAAKGLKVFTVNEREARDKVESFLKANNFTVPTLLDTEGSMADAFRAQGLPVTVVIGRDGIVKKVIVGFSGDDDVKDLRTTIEAALNAPAGSPG